MLNNASPIELVYTGFMLLALGASLVSYLWHRARRVAGERSGENGVLSVLRKGAEHDQLMLVAVCICMVVIGINALFAPPNPRVATTTALISGGAFIALSLVVLWLTISIRLRPNKLRQARDKEAQHGGS